MLELLLKNRFFWYFQWMGTRSSIIDYIYYKGFKMCTEYVTIREKYAEKLLFLITIRLRGY